MKKLLCLLFTITLLIGILSSCENSHVHNYDSQWDIVKKPTATEDGEKVRYCPCGEKQTQIIYATGKTEEDDKDEPTATDKEDVITIVDGYLVVNGVKTEHKVHTEPVVSEIDGYVAINGVKTEYKIDTADVITIEDGYLVVNGVKTEHEVELECNHLWNIETIAPTCTEEGYDINTCSFCNKVVRTNVTEATSHKFPTNYTIDNEYHWLTCSVCGDIDGKAFHTLDDEGICTICQLPVSSTPGVVYEVSSDGTYAEVIGYEGTATKVKISSEYNGVPVTKIYDSAFVNNKTITSVVIPDSVTSIGSRAFNECRSLTSVVIGDSVTSIGSRAFNECRSLTSVVIGDSVTSIGSRAFNECRSLTSVVIGDSVTNIGEGAFNYCISLTSVVIPDSVTSIGDEAFYGCTSLTSVVIGDSVTSIGSYAFGYCRSLTSVVIPDSVTSIGSEAFDSCHSSLYTEYEYGKYVRSGDNPYALLIGTTNENMSSYTIHDDTRVIANYAFSGWSRLSSITIPDGVTSICSTAFYDCTSLTSVVIGDSVTSIGSSAFYGCSSLTSIVIPDSVTSIGNYAFSNCTSLTSVVIGDSVTTIGDEAFYKCTSLTSVVIGDSVTSIGFGAFYYCSKLTDVYYTGSEADWAEISIGNCNSNLTNATIHYNYVPTEN